MLEIRITAPELSEAINNLAKALSCGHCDCHNEETRQPKPDVNPAEETRQQKEEVRQLPTEATTASSDTPSKVYTLEQIAKAGTALIDAGKMGELTALLANYGVEALTALDADKYPAFVADLQKLGAVM